MVALPRLYAAPGEHQIPVDARVHQQQFIPAHHHGPDRGPLKHPPLAGNLTMDEADVERMGPFAGTGW